MIYISESGQMPKSSLKSIQTNKLNLEVNMHTIFGMNWYYFPDFDTKCKGTRRYQIYGLKGADNINLHKARSLGLGLWVPKTKRMDTTPVEA